MSPLALFFALAIGHAVCDYPLQGDFLARAKNRHSPIIGVPWYQALTAHAAIQAGVVWYLTGSWSLATCEFAAHWIIDLAKCDGMLNYNADQLLHLLCKVAWVLLLFGFLR